MKEAKGYILVLAFIHAFVIAEVIFIHYMSRTIPMQKLVIFGIAIVTYTVYLLSVSLLIFAIEDRVWSDRKRITLLRREFYVTDLVALLPLAVLTVVYLMYRVSAVVPLTYVWGIKPYELLDAVVGIGFASLLVSIIVSAINLRRSDTRIAKITVGVSLAMLVGLIGYLCLMAGIGWIVDASRITDFY